MIAYTEYDDATGQILSYGTCSDNVFEIIQMEKLVIVGKYPDSDFYVSGGVAVEKTAMPYTISSLTAAEDEEIVISGIPVGTTVKITGNNVPYTEVVNDGVIELEFDLFGDYLVTLTGVPHLDEVINIAVAQPS